MMHRFVRRGLPAGVSIALGAGTAVLTNLVTQWWHWILAVGFVACVSVWALLAIWWEMSQGRPEQPERPTGSDIGRVWISPPYVANSVVRGRDRLIRTITGGLNAPDGRVRVLCGLAGVGKTTVALEVAARCPGGMSVWWLNGADAASLAAGLSSLAHKLDVSHDEIRRSSSDRHALANLVWDYLHNARHTWLLVIDNADDLDLLASRSGQLMDGNGLIRSSNRGLVLVTSRHNDPSAWGPTAVLHPVEPLDARTGSLLLRDIAGKQAGNAEDAAALAARFGGLPYGLVTAARYLASTDARLRGIRTFRQYLDRLDKDLAGHAAADPRRVMAAAWEMTLDHLGSQGFPAARPTVRAIGLLGSAGIPVDLAAELAAQTPRALRTPPWPRFLGQPHRPTTANQELSTLARLCELGIFSFVVAGRTPHTVSCVTTHPLIAEINRSRLQDQPVQRDALAHSIVRAIAAVVARHETDSPAEASWWPIAAVHITHMLDEPGSLRKRGLELLIGAANRAYVGLYCAGAYLNEVILTRKAADVATCFLGAHHPASMGAQHCLAGTLAGQGDPDQAERLYRSVLADRTEFFGPTHLETLETQHNLAGVLLGTGRAAEAERELAVVVRARQQALGNQHIETIRARHNLAAARADQGRLTEAEREFRSVLADFRKAVGDSNRAALITQRRLAQLFEQLGRLEEAEAELRIVAAKLRETFSDEHPEALITAHLLGRVLARQGRLDSAAKQLRPVLAARTRVLGASHPLTIETAQLLQNLDPARQ